jgi:hypothetical protein
MNDKPDAGESKGSGGQLNKPTKKPRRGLWRRFIHYELRKRNQRIAERKRKKTDEKPDQKAVRVTASATRHIAVLTYILAGVAILNLIEIYQGGVDTKALVKAAKQQACAAKSFAQSATSINKGIVDAVSKLDAQAQATQRVADTAAESLTAVQRPFIGYIPGETDLGLGTGYASIEGVWSNSGNTPAVEVWARSHFVKSKDSEPNRSFPFDSDDSIKEFVLGAHQITSFFSGPIENKDISVSGPIGYSYGWAVYKDNFKNTEPHLTEFCMRSFTFAEWGVNGASKISGRQGSCDVHNCFDRDCEDYKERINEVSAYDAQKAMEKRGRRLLKIPIPNPN